MRFAPGAADGLRLPSNWLRPSAVWLLAALPVAVILTLLPLPIAAVVVAGLLFGLLVLIEPAIGLYGAVLSVPIQELVVLPAGLTVTQIVVALAAGVWLLRVLAYPDRSLHLSYQWPWLMLLGWQLFSVLMTPYELGLGLQQWARWVAAWLAFVLTLGTITDRKRAWGLIAVLLAAPGVAALLGVNQFLTGSGHSSYLIIGGRFARATATFGKPNSYAGYLNMAWPLALTLATTFAARRASAGGRRSLLPLAVFGGCALLLLGGLFASYSRGGWVGAMLGMLGLALLAGRRSALIAGLTVTLLLMVGLLGAFSALPPVVVDRLGAIANNVRIFDAGTEMVTPENFAVVERMAHWQAAWRMWQAYPALGIGPGNFDVAYQDFFAGRWSVSQGHAHNYYLHILAESGPVGLGLYLLLVAGVFAQALRLLYRDRAGVGGGIALGVCGIMLAVAGHNVFENLHVLNLGIQLSGVWGLMIVWTRLLNVEGAHDDQVLQ